MIIITEVFILQEPYVYFILLGIAVGVGLVLFRKVKGESKKEFKPQSLSEVIINENFKPYVEQFGEKIKKGVLYTQYKNMNLRKKAVIRLKYAIPKNGNSKEMESKESDFIVFKTGKTFLCEVPILNHLVKKSEYILANKDDDVLIKDKFNNVWTTTDNVFFYRFAGLWICSKETQNFITELIYKKMLENEKEEGINYIKRIVFYNDQYASKIGSIEQEFLIEREKWKDRVERETGVRKNN